MSILTKIITAEVFYFMSILFGIWLSHYGKPFHKLLLVVHILMGLATVTLSSFVLLELIQTKVLTVPLLILILATGLLIIGLVSSGILLSLDKDSEDRVLGTHNVTTVLGIIATTLTIFLLISNKI